MKSRKPWFSYKAQPCFLVERAVGMRVLVLRLIGGSFLFVLGYLQSFNLTINTVCCRQDVSIVDDRPSALGTLPAGC